jgi:ectoine hydroxylase-related dioxygenase (phytanoyl-CoA dioxygenase family)
MALAREIYEHYWEKGWAVVENVYSIEETEHIAALATRLCEELMQEDDYIVDSSDDGARAPRKLDLPFERHPDLRNFALDRRLSSLVGEFINDQPLLLADQIFMKPPHFGSKKPYHQDNGYFHCHPGDKVLTAWIALDDVDEENGCLRYIEESNKGPILPHLPQPGEPYNFVPPADLIDLSKEALAEVRQGGVVFHHSHSLHTSHRNESDRWRRAYATHWVTAAVTSENSTLDTAYFKQDTYPS